MRVERSRRDGDREQLAATLVADQAHAEERLQAPAEAAARAPHALGDRADAPAPGRVEVQDAIGLAVAQRAQHDRALRSSTGSGSCYTICEVMNKITVYTTEPCGYCRQAKALLDKRGLELRRDQPRQGRRRPRRARSAYRHDDVPAGPHRRASCVGGFAELLSRRPLAAASHELLAALSYAAVPRSRGRGTGWQRSQT